MEPNPSGQWYFLPLEGTEVSGRGWSKGKFSICQVTTVDIRAIYEVNGVIQHHVLLPSVPRFLVSAFAYLHEMGVGVPDSGDKDETFRKAGSISRQNRFWEANQTEPFADYDGFRSLTYIDVGALIKRFLRDLKVPLIGSHSRLLAELLEEKAKNPRALEFDVTRYPLAGTLVFVLCNLHMLSERGSSRMTVDTLAIVFAPSLIRPENSKEKESLSSHQSAVLIIKYLISLSPMIMLSRECLTPRPTSVPPPSRRSDGGRSRSVVKRIIGLVRAKSQERDEPIVRGVMKSPTPVSLRRASRMSIPSHGYLSESRRSRSTARRTPCWFPFTGGAGGGGTPLSSFSSVYTESCPQGSRSICVGDSMDNDDSVKRRLFSDSEVDCAFGPTRRNSLAQETGAFGDNRRPSTPEDDCFVHDPITFVDVLDALPVCGDHVQTSLDDAFVAPPLMPPKKMHRQPDFQPNENFASMMRRCSDSSELDAVVFRTEPSFITSRPSLVQLRKNQTVQKKRAVFEKPPSMPAYPLTSKGNLPAEPRLPYHSRRNSVAVMPDREAGKGRDVSAPRRRFDDTH